MEAIKKEQTFAQIINDPRTEAMRYIIRKEANYVEKESAYIPNRGEFKKTQKEKDQLYSLKRKNIEERRKHYGQNYKKFLNIPANSLGTLKVGG